MKHLKNNALKQEYCLDIDINFKTQESAAYTYTVNGYILLMGNAHFSIHIARE